jgi:polysaccharide deacetylase 2 family uncharacterized protein YibQ
MKNKFLSVLIAHFSKIGQGTQPSFPVLKILSVLLLLIFIAQLYHSRHWFMDIPQKPAPAGVKAERKPARAVKQAPKPVKEKGVVKSLFSMFKGARKLEQDEIFLLDTKFDSLFRRFGIEKQTVRRKIKNFPRYYLEERVRLPRGKPMPEYILEIQRAVESTPFIISDVQALPRDSSVRLEFSNEDKVIRRTVIAYGDTYLTGFARAAVVLEGFGNQLNKNTHTLFSSIKRPMTIGIVPKQKFSSTVSTMALQNGWEIICQIPMESVPYKYLGKHAVYKHNDLKKLGQMLNSMGRSLAKAKGYAIYGGGIRIVENEPEILASVLKYIKKDKKFFIDNSFAQHSRARDLAFKAHVPFILPLGYGDKSSNMTDQKAAVTRFLEHIRKTGQGIILFKNGEKSLGVINYIIPLIESYGIKLVTVSSLLQ